MGALEKREAKRKSRKRVRIESEKELERLNSLPWRSAIAETDVADDDFSVFLGSNNLDGGFLSLEEIDEVNCGLEIQRVIAASKDGPVDEPCGEDDQDSRDDKCDQVKRETTKKKKKKHKKKKSQKNDAAKEQAHAGPGNDGISDGDAEKSSFDEEQYYAWNELRLHPLIMESIHRLNFKEPTAIQKACIPAAAHQGKDVIGAAETGSGKTLAFGLPIFQRLLEERDKVQRLLAEKGTTSDRIAPEGVLRALIVTPTRELALQVTDHLKAVAIGTGIRVVPVVGGMSTEKQERLLKTRPEIVVGTPGRLWEIMSQGETHLVELHSLSFFVLDEADRMLETGHFQELQSIIDMLPMKKESAEMQPQNVNCVNLSSTQRKKRQTLVFSATLALSSDFRKKLKRGTVNAKKDGLNSIETLSERAGMRANTAIIDLTNASVLVNKLVESIIECREEDKDGYLYYILSIHGHGRTIVFCTSIAAVRRISSLLRILGINVWTLHSEMQQRARLKSVDRFRANEDSILVATDAAARGLDIIGVRTVVHYQLPLSAEVYVHRCGRTARASTDGCSIALISPNDASKFAALSKSFKKESFKMFPVEVSYLPDIMKRSSLAHQIDKIVRKSSKENAERTWLERNAESIGLDLEDGDSDEETMNNKYRQNKAKSNQLKKLQQELDALLSTPLKPKTFSKRYLAGAGVSPLTQSQFEELAKDKRRDSEPNKRRKMVVIGQQSMEPLEALQNASTEVLLDLKGIAEKKKSLDGMRRKRMELKKRVHDERRWQRKKMKEKKAG